MKDLTILVGETIVVQEPTQKFSFDCYIVKGVTGEEIELEFSNGDADDGKIIKINLDTFREWTHTVVEPEADEAGDDRGSEDDFYATTTGSKYSVGSEDHGFLGEFVEYDDVLEAVAEWAMLNNWAPSLWFVSDHGNIDDKPTEYLESLPLPF